MLFQKFAVVRLMYFTYKIMRWDTLPQSPAKISGGVAYLGKVGCTQRESWVYAQGGRQNASICASKKRRPVDPLYESLFAGPFQVLSADMPGPS
jgi:hypothetical protein